MEYAKKLEGEEKELEYMNRCCFLHELFLLKRQQKADVLKLLIQYEQVLTSEEQYQLKELQDELNNQIPIPTTGSGKKFILDDEVNDKSVSGSLKNMVKPLFQILSGIVSLYFIWLSFVGLLNKITQGYLFEYVSWAKMLFYMLYYLLLFLCNGGLLNLTEFFLLLFIKVKAILKVIIVDDTINKII